MRTQFLKTLFGAVFIIMAMTLAGCGGGGGAVSGSGGGGGGTGGSVASSVTLDWVAPVSNTDGTTDIDLQGFKVYYGTTSGDYSNSVDVGNVTECVIGSLSTGTYYFVVVAYDSTGTESNPSNEISKTI